MKLKPRTRLILVCKHVENWGSETVSHRHMLFVPCIPYITTISEVQSALGLCVIYYFLCFTDASGCDIDLNVTTTKQYITTQGYPSRYLHDQDCDFQFVVPSGEKILLFFEDFQLESGYDYIYLRKLLDTE